jgi:hypothetical protein
MSAPEMGTQAPANGHRADDVAALREQILADRARLSETVAALAAKVDVRAHMQRRVARARGRLSDASARVRRLASPATDLVLAAVFAASATVAVTVAVSIAVSARREVALAAGREVVLAGREVPLAAGREAAPVPRRGWRSS